MALQYVEKLRETIDQRQASKQVETQSLNNMTLASSPSLPYPHWPANGTVGEKVCRTLDSQPVAAHH